MTILEEETICKARRDKMKRRAVSMFKETRSENPTASVAAVLRSIEKRIMVSSATIRRWLIAEGEISVKVRRHD